MSWEVQVQNIQDLSKATVDLRLDKKNHNQEIKGKAH